MGKYPVVTYDEPGSDPNRPDNSRFTIGDTRITSGPSIDPRHQGGTFISVEHGGGKRSMVYDDDDSDDTPQRDSSGCYIASAVFGSPSGGNADMLEPLKVWRYAVMEQSRLGLWMSSLYRRSAPITARKVSTAPLICSLLRHIFVDPALRLTNEKPSFLRDVQLYCLFLGVINLEHRVALLVAGIDIKIVVSDMCRMKISTI